jgi:phenylpropionate dioxygenase-like ring-hydroxylating dioxygenase large terminal subunit
MLIVRSGLTAGFEEFQGLNEMSERSRVGGDWLAVCNSVDVPDGGVRGFVVGDMQMVVWRDSIGGAHVWRDWCPHRGARLSVGIVMRDLIVCPDHGWSFDIEGQCVHLPSNGAQRGCAVVFEAEEKDGVVWVKSASSEPEPLN